MRLLSAIGGGFAGAAVLTLLHETVRRLIPEAPRMDLLGMEAISKTIQRSEVEVPEEDALFKITMAGDMVSNSLYYSLVGIGDEKNGMISGVLLGLTAGLGAIYLPKPLGLNPAPSNRTSRTKLMTLGLYLAGGVVASVTSIFLEKYQNKRN